MLLQSHGQTSASVPPDVAAVQPVAASALTCYFGPELRCSLALIKLAYCCICKFLVDKMSLGCIDCELGHHHQHTDVQTNVYPMTLLYVAGKECLDLQTIQ